MRSQKIDDYYCGPGWLEVFGFKSQIKPISLEDQIWITMNFYVKDFTLDRRKISFLPYTAEEIKCHTFLKEAIDKTPNFYQIFAILTGTSVEESKKYISKFSDFDTEYLQGITYKDSLERRIEKLESGLVEGGLFLGKLSDSKMNLEYVEQMLQEKFEQAMPLRKSIDEFGAHYSR